MRIAYFGLPLGALALRRAGFDPCLVALADPAALGARRLRRELARTPLLLRPSLHEPETVARIAAVAPDAIFSWFYPKQIPEAVLQLAPRGAFGTHPSLLPRWRGPDPYFWALYAGDVETGVSLHRLERDYDTGPVIEQVRVAIPPGDDAWRLARRLDRPALALLIACARRLANGEALGGAAQDEAQVTLAPAPDESLLAIDWSRPAAEIVRLVRAAAPFPGASAELGDELVDVLRAEVYAGALPRALKPADAVETPQGLVVTAGDRGVRVVCARLENGRQLTGAELFAPFPGGLARVGFEAGNF